MRILDVAAEETLAVRRRQKEEQDSMAEASAGTSETVEEPEPIIADKKSKTYYLGACRPEKEIAATDKMVFKTTEEAEKAGFKLAKNCH